VAISLPLPSGERAGVRGQRISEPNMMDSMLFSLSIKGRETLKSLCGTVDVESMHVLHECPSSAKKMLSVKKP